MTDDSNTEAQQRRELTEPTERTQPIPIVVAVVTLLMVLFGAGYILLSEPPGEARLGDRRTVDDLRSAAAKPAGTVDGAHVYNANCVACHQATGKGMPGVFPPLDGSEWVNGDERVLANIVLHGITGDITVMGQAYKGAMPSFAQLGDAELAAVLSHVRSTWSNKAAPLKAEVVEKERKANPRTTPFASGDEVKALVAKTP